MPKRGEFTHPRFVLAEGFEDGAFIRQLIEVRHLQDFNVSPNIDIAQVGGNSGFEASIGACEPITGFTEVTDVVLVGDNDDNPKASFDSICTQLENARKAGSIKRSWGSPTAPATKAMGDPTVSIWMWPAPGEPGCFETVCWEVVKQKYPNDAKCVDEVCACTGADKWPKTKLDKARIRCFLSLKCRGNPAIGLGLLWRDFPLLIPAAHKAFTPITHFLAAI
jgi:hypothetical protein